MFSPCSSIVSSNISLRSVQLSLLEWGSIKAMFGQLSLLQSLCDIDADDKLYHSLRSSEELRRCVFFINYCEGYH